MTGDFDLSVGSLASLVGVIVRAAHEGRLQRSLQHFRGLALGGICGLANGALVAYADFASIASLTTNVGFAPSVLRRDLPCSGFLILSCGSARETSGRFPSRSCSWWSASFWPG